MGVVHRDFPHGHAHRLCSRTSHWLPCQSSPGHLVSRHRVHSRGSSPVATVLPYKRHRRYQAVTPLPPLTGGFSHCAQYTCTVALVSTSDILRKRQLDTRRITQTEGLNMFRSLDQVEQQQWRQWTRDHYEPLTPVSDIWHPVVRDECRIINEEAETTLEEYMRER